MIRLPVTRPLWAFVLASAVVLAQTPEPTTPAVAAPSTAVAAPAPVAAAPAKASKSVAAKPAAGSSRGAASVAKGPRANDRIDLDAAQITGNRELPKVLYIVPWKRPELGDLLGKPVNSLLDEVLAPVDRDVFRRENRYFEALQPAGRQVAEPKATAGDGANPPPVAKPEN